jgi:hypothetical protein
VIVSLFYVYKTRNNSPKSANTEFKPFEKVNAESYRNASSLGIDSILYNFGVKPEKITTRYKDNKASWFIKNAEIPKTLNTTKINFQITDFLRDIGLNPVVTEDIRTRNIAFTVYNDTNNSGSPLAKIFINHETKK